MLSILLFIREVVRGIYYHFSDNDRIEKVWRLPAAKALNANFLGLTLGVFAVVLETVFRYSDIFLPGGSSDMIAGFYRASLLLALFVFGSYLWRAFFVLGVAASLAAVLLFAAPQAGSLIASFKILARWFVGGYGFGTLLAILYNDLVFLYLRIFESEEIGLAFAYFPNKAFNIIKAPNAEEEEAYRILELNNAELRKRRVYDFKLENVPPQPYTILFIANPYVQSRDEGQPFKLDPMINLPELFYHSVDWAMRSLESNEIIGKRAIWGKVRVVTIFDPKMKEMEPEKVALVQEFGNLVIDGETPLNLIAPRDVMNDRVASWLPDYSNGAGLNIASSGGAKLTVDVIFALSAHPTHDRSMALFSDIGQDGLAVATIAATGNEFEFAPDPGGRKGGDIRPPAIPARTYHELFSARPGRVALNVLGAIPRTFVHEFAHAMSSAVNGMVTDEYADKFEVGVEPSDAPPFYINRIVRQRPSVRVHKIFSDYEEVRFTSELDHPSERENWYGYFPDGEDSTVSCIMDRFTNRHAFDSLLANFIYDRLHAKVNR